MTKVVKISKPNEESDKLILINNSILEIEESLKVKKENETALDMLRRTVYIQNKCSIIKQTIHELQLEENEVLKLNYYHKYK